MDTGSVEDLVEETSSSSGSEMSGTMKVEERARHEWLVDVSGVLEVAGKEILEGITPVVHCERVVAAEEGPEHFERVHRVEREVPVEAAALLMLPCGRGSSWVESVLAVLVVGAAFLVVTEDFVSLGDLLEPLLSVVGLVLVRVVLERLLPVGLLDLVGRGPAANVQNGVVILAHDCTLKFLSSANYHVSLGRKSGTS